MKIFVNKASNSGAGGVKWEKVEQGLNDKKVKYSACYPPSAGECSAMVKNEIKKGNKVFIAAGGDGTANLVLNTIMDSKKDKPYPGIVYGAIGLGSSNDLHKPFEEFSDIEGIPLRIDQKKAKPADVGKLKYTDIEGKDHVKYFILNASIGFVAEGNAYFNSGKKVVNWLNNKSNDLAILWTILVNLFTFKNFKAKIRIDDDPEEEYTVTAMGILKKVQFAGDMRYDTPVTEDDGMLDICLWNNMGKIRLLKTLFSLFDGKFTGLPKTKVSRAKKITITSSRPIHVETDGEISKVVKAELSVLPKVLKICR